MTPASFKNKLLALAENQGVALDGQSCILVSHSNRSVVRAFDGLYPTILGVPFSSRNAAKQIFLQSVALPLVEGRTNPLLCNLGISGSGKTVQQVLNMCWFREYHHHPSISFEVSFNDDSVDLRLDHGDTFNDVMVRGILLRLAERCAGMNFSEAPKANQQMQDILDIDFSQLKLTILEAIALAREVLGFGEDAPALLVVDEISKRKNSKEALSSLCNLVDREAPQRPRRFWLSASTYGCFQLKDFQTNSNRPILLQPLPPILLDSFTSNEIDSLPPLLRVLISQEKKSTAILEIKRKVSRLLLLSGGHPRLLSALLQTLGQAQSMFLESLNARQSKKLRSSLKLSEGLSVLLTDKNPFLSLFLKTVDKICTLGESLMITRAHVIPEQLQPSTIFNRDLVVPFGFPTDEVQSSSFRFS